MLRLHASRKDIIFDCALDTPAGFAFLTHDSAKQTSLMALAALSVQKCSNIFGILLA
jgi:hypothetical protein